MLKLTNIITNFYNRVDLERNDYPRDATIHGDAFVIPNFTVSTSLAQIAHIVSDGSRVEVAIVNYRA